MADIEKALTLKNITNLKIKVPKYYYGMLHVFLKTKSDKLLKRTLYNYKIKLEPGK